MTLDELLDDDRRPGERSAGVLVGVLAPAPVPPTDWREALSVYERRLLPPAWNPDPETVAALLTARELFDGELVAIRPALRVDDLPADLRELFEERAAIREHDGGEPRDLAEREALAEIAGMMRVDIDGDVGML